MVANIFDKALKIKMKPSMGQKLVIILPHVGICIVFFIALYISGFDSIGLARILLVIPLLCIVISYIYYSRLHLTHSLKKSILCINKDLSNGWSLTFKDDRNENVSLSATSFISNFLIILNFIDDSGKQEYAAVLTSDSVSKDEFRRLKVLLKTKNN